MKKINESELEENQRERRSIKSGISGSFTRRTNEDKISGDGEVPNPESSAGHEPVCAQKTAFEYTGRCVLRVKVFRKRLCDPDGNLPKWHIDAIRNSKFIRDDSAKEVDYYFEGQEKVETAEEERVEITLEYSDAKWSL